MQSGRLLKIIAALVISTLSLCGVSAQQTAPSCMATEAALEFWRPVRESVREAELDSNELARDLLGCLASPNSELRDTIAYELLTFWLRSDSLSERSKLEMLQVLSENVSTGGESNSLRRSFSALILSELLRADSQSTFMSEDQRLELLTDVVDALAGESDYRGLVDGLGWVHPIAHMADVLWRFSLHESLDMNQARLVLRGVRSKAGTSEAGYAFNEGDRLARPVAVLIARKALAETEIIEWLSSFDSPISSASWFDAFASSEGMLELHNSKLFVRALSDQLVDSVIDSDVRAKLEELVTLFTSTV